MKIFAEKQDFGRYVGVLVLRNTEVKGLVERGGLGYYTTEEGHKMPRYMGDLEAALEWSRPIVGAERMTNWETVRMPIAEVQQIFDALWEAGIRPTKP